MIYLYAIVDQPGTALPSLAGMEDVPLVEVIYQDLAGVCRTFTFENTSDILSTKQANLWRHESILEALMTDHTVLPVCFGAVFASESDLLTILGDKYASFSANLGRVRGCVELSLRITWIDEQDLPPWASSPSQPEQPAEKSGKNYMLALQKARQREQALCAQIETQTGKFLPALNRLVIEKKSKVSITHNPTLTAAYLLDAQKVPFFQQEVDQLVAAHSDFHFTLTGPWPAYSFIND